MFIKLTMRCQEPKDELSEAPAFSCGEIQKERAAPWPLAPFPGLEKEVKKGTVDLGCSARSCNVERGIVHTMYSLTKGGGMTSSLFLIILYLEPTTVCKE